MSKAGIGHDFAKGASPTSTAKHAKQNADQLSTKPLGWGVDVDGCPKTDDAPRRLDAIQNEVLCVMDEAGLKYDPCETDNLARAYAALTDDNQTTEEVLRPNGDTAEQCFVDIKTILQNQASSIAALEALNPVVSTEVIAGTSDILVTRRDGTTNTLDLPEFSGSTDANGLISFNLNGTPFGPFDTGARTVDTDTDTFSMPVDNGDGTVTVTYTNGSTHTFPTGPQTVDTDTTYAFMTNADGSIVITGSDGSTFTGPASTVDTDTDTFATLMGQTINFPDGNALTIPTDTEVTIQDMEDGTIALERVITNRRLYHIVGSNDAVNAQGDPIEQTHVGVQAGENNTAIAFTGVGVRTGQNNSGVAVSALGNSAARDNTGNSVSAFGSGAGLSNSGNNSTLIGRNNGANNTGVNVTSVGFNAALNNGGTNSTFIGFLSGSNNTAPSSTAVGNGSAANNTGPNFSGLGLNVGQDNTAANFSGIGGGTGSRNSGANFSGFGFGVGPDNTGDNFTGAGVGAGSTNSGDNFTGVGASAGSRNNSDLVTCVGTTAAQNNNAENFSGLGSGVGINNLGINFSGVGVSAGANNDGVSNSYFGAFSGSTFVADGANPINGAITVGTGTVAAAAHGRPVGTVVNLRFAGATPPAPIANGDVVSFFVTDANTLTAQSVIFTSAGTTWTLFPQLASSIHNGSTAVGAFSLITASNQVRLGNNATAQVFTSGDIMANGVFTASDERLKKDFVEKGEVSGISLYSYKYDEDMSLVGETFVGGKLVKSYCVPEKSFGVEQLGVKAQELIGTEYEDALSKDGHGFYSVNYEKLMLRMIMNMSAEITALKAAQ